MNLYLMYLWTTSSQYQQLDKRWIIHIFCSSFEWEDFQHDLHEDNYAIILAYIFHFFRLSGEGQYLAALGSLLENTRLEKAYAILTIMKFQKCYKWR